MPKADDWSPEGCACGTLLAVSSDASVGHHLCTLPAGHEGQHECDTCPATWMTPAAPLSSQREPR